MEIKGVERLQNYWYGLLARRDYSEGELRKKAGEKGYESEVVSQGIALFLEQNLINDARLAANIVEFYGAQRGPMWLRTKLIKRGLSREIISDALQDYTPHIDRSFGSAMLQRYRVTTRNQVDQKMKARLYRYVASRGYMDAGKIVESALEGLE